MASLGVIYISDAGKRAARLCRGAGFLEKSAVAAYSNEKALADVNTEELTNMVGFDWDTSWVYQGTQVINSKGYHHYKQKAEEGKEPANLWVTVERF